MNASASVIIVSYRPGDWLAEAVASVADRAGQVVVVDNASPDGQAADVARRAGADVVYSRTNLGFAGGVAAGLERAGGAIVGILNDDARAGPDWLDSAAELLADPEVAAVTPKVVLATPYLEVTVPGETWSAPGDPRPLGSQIRALTAGGRDVLAAAVGGGIHDLESDGPDRWRWTAGSRPFYVPVPDGQAVEVRADGEPATTGPVVRLVNHAGSYLRGHGIAGEYGFGAPDDGRFDAPAERFGFSGTAPVFRTATLQRLGGFAPRFFAYNEDTDWCLRARLAGMRILYDPHATVTHRLSATSGGTGAARVRHLSQRNALLCLMRNAPLGLARREVQQRLGRGWSDPVARDVARQLPWALSSRLALSRRWVERPEDIWARWADRDMSWDASPAGVGPPGP